MFPTWHQLSSEQIISSEEKVKLECQHSYESWTYGNCLSKFLSNFLKFLSRLKMALPVYSANHSDDDDCSDELFSGVRELSESNEEFSSNSLLLDVS